MSRLFMADQLCTRQPLASVGLHSWLMWLGINVFAYGVQIPGIMQLSGMQLSGCI